MDTITVSEFAALVGVSTRTVSDLVKRGVISKVGTAFRILNRFNDTSGIYANLRPVEAARRRLKSRRSGSASRDNAGARKLNSNAKKISWVYVGDVELHWCSNFANAQVRMPSDPDPRRVTCTRSRP